LIDTARRDERRGRCPPQSPRVNDGYLQSDLTPRSAPVSGRIVAVAVQDLAARTAGEGLTGGAGGSQPRQFAR
jgi:hypothetical protein